MILWLLCACNTQEVEKEKVVQPKKTVSFSSRSSKDLHKILKEEGYVQGEEHSDFALYSFFSKPIQATIAVDVQPQFFSFLHIPSGVHAYGKRSDAISDVWALHQESFPEKTDRTVAYGGVPWFSGSSLQRAPLLAHMGLYFHRLEQEAGVTPYEGTSAHVFSGVIDGDPQEVLKRGGLSCSSFAKKQYWCEFPQLDLSCVQKTQAWKEELLSFKLDLPTEGMYRSVFRTQEIGLCLPSGCYECDTISCAKKRSSDGLPVVLSHDNWAICLEKNLDEDAERTQLCLSKSSFSNKELSLYVDDCILHQ